MMPVHVACVQFYVCMPVMRWLNDGRYTYYSICE